MSNHFIDLAEILVDHETRDIGLRFGDSDTFVLPPRAAESLARGLLECVEAFRPAAATPSKARWACG